MSKTKLTEDTIIEIGKSIALSKFRDFFEEATGKDLSGAEFQSWLNTQAGKTLKEAVGACSKAPERKHLNEIIEEDRFFYD